MYYLFISNSITFYISVHNEALINKATTILAWLASIISYDDSEPEAEVAEPDDPEIPLEPQRGGNFSGANSPWFNQQENEESNIHVRYSRRGKNHEIFWLISHICLEIEMDDYKYNIETLEYLNTLEWNQTIFKFNIFLVTISLLNSLYFSKIFQFCKNFRSLEYLFT